MPSEDNAYGERIYFWVDDKGIRCGPRHKTMKAALNFYQNQEGRWVSEGGRPFLVEYDRKQFPSQGDPVELRIGEYVERSLNEEDKAKIDQVKSLMRDGFV